MEKFEKDMPILADGFKCGGEDMYRKVLEFFTFNMSIKKISKIIRLMA